VLNAAQGKRFTQIDTNQAYYDKYGIKYYGCELMDFAQAKIDHYIDAAVEFIHQALDVENGRILIHCYMGVSRSATFMLAYMIKYKKMRLEDAIRLASEKRYIAPNDGFLSKLIEYEKNNLVQV
jgi:protein-tyrosine phosphatase